MQKRPPVLCANVSIIIPVYNTARELPICLESVLAEQGCRLEVIAVNDGSTDESGQILATYASRYPALRVETLPVNRGVAAARNRGLELATGEYILFVDSDDRLLPGAVSRLLNAVMPRAPDITMFLHQTIKEIRKSGESSNLPAFLSSRLEGGGDTSPRSVGGNQRFFDLRNPAVRRESFDLAVGNLWAWNGLFRRKALGDLRFAPLSNGEDMLFGAQAYCRAQTFATAPMVVYEYLQRSGSLSQRNLLPHVCDAIKAVARLFESIRTSGFYPEVADLMFRKLRTLAFGTTLDRLLRLPPRERQSGWICWFDQFKSVFQASSVKPQPRRALIRCCFEHESPFLVCLLLRAPVVMKARILTLPGVRRWWIKARRRGIERHGRGIAA